MPFTIKPILFSQVEAMAQVIFDSFARDQFDSEHVNQEFLGYLTYVSSENVQNALGYVALNENDEVIGGVLCCDLNGALSFEGADEDSMMAILKLLNSKYFENLMVEEKAYLQVKFIGVHTDYVGQGVATSLINAALENALSLGFKFAQAESAGSRSQWVFEKKGFVAKAEVKYDEFIFNDTKPFPSTEDHQSIKLMIKEL